MIKKKEDEKKKEVSSVMTKDKMDDPCPPKDDDEDDMRGTYARVNIIKNKLRAMGAKNPQAMTLSPTKGQKLNMYGEEKVDGSKERTAADPGMSGRMGRTPKKEEGPKTPEQAPPKGDEGPKTKKPRYNPFKDGRTPTSASETTGP